MPSERIQRQIDRLLDEADASVSSGDWQFVAEKARAALAIDAENVDALTFLRGRGESRANPGNRGPADRLDADPER